MACKDALIDKVLTLKPEQTVEQALKELKKGKTVFAPVLDGNREFVGVFSVSRLLYDVLPVSVSVGEEGSLRNVRIPAAPGMTKRLQKDKSSLVSELMERHVPVVSPEAALETAIRYLRERGEPVIVVDEQSGAFKGIITDESLLAALEKMV